VRTPRARREAGVSLLEVAVATAIFLALLTTATQSLVRCAEMTSAAVTESALSAQGRTTLARMIG
jgi:hypothetical protein